MAMETQNRVVYEGEPVRQEEHITHEHHEPSSGEMMAKGGLGLAVFAGVCTVVLAILGLVNILPFYMACIAAIVVGAGFLFEGRTMGAIRPVERFTEMRDGMVGAESIGGIAAIVLGILALVGNSPLIMLSVSVLALGAALVIGSLARGFGGAKAFLGLSSLVLGVLCLMGVMSLTLLLVGYICLGTASLLSGSAKLVPATRI